MLNRKIFETKIDGEPVSLEISELAKQANAAVIGRHGDTAVLATVVMGDKNSQADYFPLTVDYEERFYAAGKIIGSRFVRREGRPSDEATLSARLIDRSIRPLFDERLRREIQVVVTVLAYDEKNDPDAIALLATSTALTISEVPWNGPVGGIKIQNSKSNGELYYQTFFAGPEEKINMIEFEGNEVSEEELGKIFVKAQNAIRELIDFQKQIVKEVGRPKININFAEADPRIKKIVLDFTKDKIEEALSKKATEELKTALLEELKNADEDQESIQKAGFIFEEETNAFLRNQIIEKEKRPDKRSTEEIRELYSEVGLFRKTHGSALFMRGDTQILAVTTLASPSAEQLVETMEMSGKKRFMLHYNFPSFSVGETGRSRGPGRREIGHGTLAAKALNAVLPAK
ncbi:MAG: polyribonucleotide nucleotidyltransferase, partial [Patescibacteria group bacterium]